MARSAVAGALLFAVLSSGCAPPERPGPNILLVMFDTLRRDHTSVDGYPHDTTPTLARLAERGVTFSSAYSPSATTGPSTVSLFTSLYPITHGYLKNGLRLGEGYVTLAERLQEAGYQTAAVASSVVLAGNRGLLQGFESVSDEWPVEHSSWDRRGPNREDPPRYRFDRKAEHSVDEMIRWLREERDPGRPFFAFLHLMDPHEPYDPPADELLRVRGDRRNLTWHERLVLRYDADIAYADRELGRLLAVLEEITEPTDLLVAAVADHGQGLDEHGWHGHGVQIYEEAVRIPLVLRYPGTIDAGKIVEEPVEILDVVPTLLSYAGIDVAKGELQGVDLRPAIDGEKPLSPDRPVYLQRRAFASDEGPNGEPIRGEMYGLVWRGYKYIEAKEQGRYELYALDSDPGELVNVYDEQRATARRMAAAMARWRKAYQREPADVTASASKEELEALRALGYVE